MSNGNNKMRVRKGDTVKVMSGKDAGTTSVVMRAIPESRKIVVEKVAVARKAQRPTRDNPSGGIMSIEMPIHVSTVMLVCPKCSKPTRVGMRLDEDKKVRVCKKCGKDID
ncbi:MAG: 50S ribosomal protein L24 [Coriobacteriales bacterium]|jgi:large subunit ribosomal protein L24|nr:50S ribosomal protein L24 [Coriobacteriales bacterium]